MSNRWYYYLHTNGDVIGKNPFVVESDSQYFVSDFVRKYWLIEDRRSLVSMLVDLKEMGAREDRVLAIEEKNNITEADYKRLRKEKA